MDMVKNLSLNYSFQYPQRNEKLKDLNIFNIMSLLVLTLLAVLVIGGNVLVITAFVSVGRKIQNLTNYFVVSLAVSDILVGAFSIPFWIWMQIKRTQLASTSHYIFVAFDIMCGVASIVNLTVISLERLFAVVRPASHRNLSRKTHLVFVVIISVWIFAIINSALYFVKAFYKWTDYNIYIVSIGFFLPALVIVASYIAIYKVAQMHVSETRRLEQEMRLAGMIAIVITLFIFCWFPFFLINILYAYCEAPVCDAIIMRKSIPFVKFLHYSNSMMNPVIYAYRNSDYRDAFKELLSSVLPSWFLESRKRKRSSLKLNRTLNSECTLAEQNAGRLHGQSLLSQTNQSQ